RVAEIARDENPGQARHGGLAGIRCQTAAAPEHLIRDLRRACEQRAANRPPGKAGRAFEQLRTTKDFSAFVPDELAVSAKARRELAFARGVALSRSPAAEAQDFSAQVARLARKANFGLHPGERAVVDDRFLRQPLQ